MHLKKLIHTLIKKAGASILAGAAGLSLLGTPISVSANNTPFYDVLDNVWYSEGVQYVYDYRIMTGLSPNEFGLETPVDRAMMITILYRIAGQPQSSGSHTFADVPADAYYAPAVQWAYQRGITTGLNPNEFGSSQTLKREDLAVFLYRFHEYLGYDNSLRGSLAGFADNQLVDAYALDAMSWAVGKGFISGDNGLLNPQGFSNRAVAATIVSRYLQSFDSNQSQKPSTSGSVTKTNTFAQLASYWSQLKSTYPANSRLIVRCRSDLSNPESYGATRTIAGPDSFYIMQFADAAAAQSARSNLAASSNVRYVFVEPDEKGYEHLSYGPDMIRADSYKSRMPATNNAPVVVALIDTGADLTHPRLQARLLGGYDFASYDNDPMDSDGHGSHVAGIIADTTQGKDVYLLPIQIFSKDNPYSTDNDVANGIEYALEQGANVINLSIGIKGHSQAVDQAIAKALAKGVTVVAAAGNDGISVDNYCPAHMKELIAVGAVDETKTSGWYSNYGDSIDLVAPGSKINSTYTDNGYHELTGTSMAAPFVSAAASLILLQNPGLQCSQVESILREATEDLGDKGWDPYYGYGLLNMDRLP